MRVNLGARSVIRRALRWLPALLWMSGIFYLSHQASPPTPAGPNGGAALAHVAAYAVLSLLLFAALRPDGRAVPAWVAFAIAFALTVLYGVTDEVHQAFVPGRVASEADLAFDGIGGALGAGIALIVAERVGDSIRRT